MFSKPKIVGPCQWYLCTFALLALYDLTDVWFLHLSLMNVWRDPLIFESKNLIAVFPSLNALNVFTIVYVVVDGRPHFMVTASI